MKINKQIFWEFTGQAVEPATGVIVIKHHASKRMLVVGTTVLSSYVKLIDRGWRNGKSINCKAFKALNEYLVIVALYNYAQFSSTYQVGSWLSCQELSH